MIGSPYWLTCFFRKNGFVVFLILMALGLGCDGLKCRANMPNRAMHYIIYIYIYIHDMLICSTSGLKEMTCVFMTSFLRCRSLKKALNLFNLSFHGIQESLGSFSPS